MSFSPSLLSLLLLLLLSLSLSSSSLAAELMGTIAFPPQFPRPYPPIRLSINGGQIETLSRPDGSFLFTELPAGGYKLEVLSTQLMYPQYLVEVDEDQSVMVSEMVYHGAKKMPIYQPILIQPLVTYQYFQIRPSFSIWGLITGNPMMVMMAVSMGAMFLLPKMMSGMDPEEMKRIQKEMGTSGDPMEQFQGLLGLGKQATTTD